MNKKELVDIFYAVGNANNEREEVEQLREVVKRLPDIDASYDGQTLLHQAVGSGRPLVVAMLLQQGADPTVLNSHGLTPLQLAKNFYQSHKIIGPGADWADWQPTEEDYERIVHLIESSGSALDAKKQAWEIEGGVNVVDYTDSDHDEPQQADTTEEIDEELDLQSSVLRGNIAMVHHFLKKGESPNQSDADGRTLLHYACYDGRSDIAIALVEHGADINKKSHQQRSPLHEATFRQPTDSDGGLISFLVSKGANIHEGDENGSTPLHLAATANNTLSIEELIRNGANINYTANNGITPLHAAAYSCKPEATSLLIEKGANIEAKLENGMTPLYMAENSTAANKDRQGEVVNLLQEATRDPKSSQKVKSTASKEANTKQWWQFWK